MTALSVQVAEAIAQRRRRCEKEAKRAQCVLDFQPSTAKGSLLIARYAEISQAQHDLMAVARERAYLDALETIAAEHPPGFHACALTQIRDDPPDQPSVFPESWCCPTLRAVTAALGVEAKERS